MSVPALSIQELQDRARVVAIPTRTRFRGVTVREALLLRGENGWTEFSPFPEYGDTEATTWLAAALEYGWGELPEPVRSTVAVNGTIPAVAANEVAPILERFDGVTTVKVKVAERGQSLAEDVARVREVRRLLGGAAKIRIDANGGWNLNEAVYALQQLGEFGLDYAEQPVLETEDLARLRERLSAEGVPVRIAADESVRKAEDPLEVARLGAADLLVVKAQPLGGVTRALEVVRAAALPVVISSALDTSVGISMGAHLAAALPVSLLDGACGLGTVALLDGDVTASPLVPAHGELAVTRPAVSAELCERFAAHPERADWWLERLTRCAAALGLV